ncbi:hypothetical protein N0V90_009971 [Kalmusia sp. IMI 367209]|nr:hypothetical protein N0V90_009971 [Kalmusia sp. IMI 367209]
MLPFKNPMRTIAKHVTRPKPKTASARALGKKILSLMPHTRPEKRGLDRTRTIGSLSLSQWSARRILASRPNPEHPSRLQYKVQWETTWEDATDITGLAAGEWKEALHNDDTFVFKPQSGDEWTVLKDATCLENDSEESQWEMWRAIRRNAIREIGNNFCAGLKDGEVIFASATVELEVRQDLEGEWQDEKISAENVLRAAWRNVDRDHRLLDEDIPFGNVKVCCIAQLDPWLTEDVEDLRMQQRTSFTVAEIIRAVIPNPIEELDEHTFSKDDAYFNYPRWREVTRALVRKVPFLFKSGTWMQLFAFLILGSELFLNELALVGIKVQEDWCQRAREYDMHMYYERIVDDRSTHDIQETFLNLRDFFRNMGLDKRDANDREHVSDNTKSS